MVMSMAKEIEEIPLNLEEGINTEMIKNIELKNLRSRRRLCLVLDLDHTLIHTKRVLNLSPQQKQNLSNHPGDVYSWELLGVKYLTKLRPFVGQFLKQASEMFELYVYTMGTQDYALHIVEFLDPEGVYFGSRVIAREDCTVQGEKGLDVVPVHEDGVLILDDTESVWKRNLENLILIDKYYYFSDKGSDESEEARELSFALRVLTRLHSLYFDWYDFYRDGDMRDLMSFFWEDIINDEGQQEVGTGTTSSDMGFGKRSRVDEECPCPSQDVTKKQRIHS